MQKHSKINLFKYEFHLELVCKKRISRPNKPLTLGQSIRRSKDYREFVKRAKAQHPQYCWNCETNNGNLQLHHIIGVAENPSLAMVFENTILLCEKCHDQIHKDTWELKELVKAV